MARAKQVRWECPNGLHPGKLGVSRPRKNASVRFCFSCSEEAGVLVERVSPAIERKRNAKASAAAERQQRKREAEKVARANRHKVTVLGSAGGEVVLDLGVLLAEAWRTRVLRDEQRDAFLKLPAAVPELIVRRGAPDAGRPQRRVERGLHAESLPIRARDGLSGHAKGSGDEIVMTIRPNCGEEWARAVVIHEAAHAAAPAHVSHGSRWKRAYVRTVQACYPSVVLPSMVELDGLAAWQLDEVIAAAIHEARRS